ncbi:ribonuclease HIII [bacterium]|nr:ribonuclease HIII [bacterium]
MKKISPELDYVVTRFQKKLADLYLIDIDPIDYGVKILLNDGSNQAGGNLYYSPKKKRFSYVPNRKGDEAISNALQENLADILGTIEKKTQSKGAVTSNLDHQFVSWIGTDEAGKGDIFGPLVVAGFFVQESIIPELKKLNLRDSKDLSAKRIAELSQTLHDRFKQRVEIIRINPKRYNEMQASLIHKGGINGVMGWAHTQVIKNLSERFKTVEGVVIDKFMNEGKMRGWLGEDFSLKLLLEPRAESDVAVAAASILARNNFNQALAGMEAELGFIPHAGSGDAAAKDLAQLYKLKSGELNLYVKTHFKPVKKLGI